MERRSPRRVRKYLGRHRDRPFNLRTSKGRSVILGDGVPVHHIPPSFDVIRPAVLVVEIIGVFPNIKAKHWRVPVHKRTVLIRGRDDLELSVLVLDEPRPTAAKATRPGCREFFLKRIETAERV